MKASSPVKFDKARRVPVPLQNTRQDDERSGGCEAGRGKLINDTRSGERTRIGHAEVAMLGAEVLDRAPLDDDFRPLRRSGSGAGACHRSGDRARARGVQRAEGQGGDRRVLSALCHFETDSRLDFSSGPVTLSPSRSSSIWFTKGSRTLSPRLAATSMSWILCSIS